MLYRYYNLIFPHTLPIKKNGIHLSGIDISVDDLNAELQLNVDESYELSIPADGKAATLHAKTVYGAYHGLETLSQIVVYNYTDETYIIKKAPYTIQDAPSYSVYIIIILLYIASWYINGYFSSLFINKKH